MITVADNKQNIKSKVVLTTVNCDGLIRYWYMNSIEELHKNWWDEEYDGPSSDDPVLEFKIGGKKQKNVKYFGDIANAFNFDVEVDPRGVVWNTIEGPLEYASDEILSQY